jgi:pimeloyl-ACP methyl ester carboxylesterase
MRAPITVARQFEEAIPNPTLVVIERAGHLSHLERPAGEQRRARILSRPPAGIRLGEPGKGLT